MMITVRVKTGARVDSVSYDDEADIYLVTVRARPLEGEANEAIIQILSKELKVPKTLISLESGTKSNIKRFRIQK